MTEKKLESFRLSLFARAVLLGLADAEGMTKTAYLERLLRAEAKRKKITLADVEPDPADPDSWRVRGKK